MALIASTDRQRARRTASAWVFLEILYVVPLVLLAAAYAPRRTLVRHVPTRSVLLTPAISPPKVLVASTEDAALY